MAEDYYKTLGVEKKASQEDIKKAYRKLAVKFHPDKHKGKKEMEEKFKKINEAYAVIGDEEKRRQYDTFGAEGFSQQFSQEDIFKGFDFNNVHSDFGFGKDFFGDDIFDTLFGAGMNQSGQNYTFRFGEGAGFDNERFAQGKPIEDAQIELSITFEDVVQGTTKTITATVGKKKEKLQVKIPKGIEEGQKLRIKGKGPVDRFTKKRGDLYAKITIEKHPVFIKEGRDLIIDVDAKLTNMVLGGKVRISTITKKTIELKIPAGTKNNATLRIKGEGIPEGKKGRGNLLVRLHALVPDKLNKEQKKLFEELRDSGL